jgi:hypothetical protein
MGQVTVYLDEETENLMKMAAQSSGMSQSKWVASLIRAKAGTEWPPAVAALAGAWPDMPTAEEIRATQPADARREKL